MENLSQQIQGAVRTGTQMFWTLIATWLVNKLGLDIDTTQAVGITVFVIMVVLWTVGNWAQHLPAVEGNVILRYLFGLLMGGWVKPEYNPPTPAS